MIPLSEYLKIIIMCCNAVCLSADLFSILANTNGAVECKDLAYFCAVTKQVCPCLYVYVCMYVCIHLV